jgi:tetratricopeptide (TPR) repeat protein
MNCGYQHGWLPALAAAAAFTLGPIAVSGQASVQVASLAPGPGSIQNPAQTTPQTPGASQSPRPADATQDQPAVVGAPAASTLAPGTPEEVGDALMAQLRYQAAIEAYKKIPHRSADVWNKMGIAYQMMFNQDEALHCYQVSLRLEPRNSRVMNNLGTIYDAEKEYSNAERMYRKALKVDPKSGIIYKNLGTNLLAQHNYTKGGEMYKIALQLDPNVFTNNSTPRVQNPTSLEERGAMNYYMARGCVRAGMNDCAIDYLRMALNEGFTNPKKLQADSEFAGLRGVPAFQQLLAEQRQQ